VLLNRARLYSGNCCDIYSSSRIVIIVVVVVVVVVVIVVLVVVMIVVVEADVCIMFLLNAPSKGATLPQIDMQTQP
jgi:hypothetical protein